MAIVYQQLLPEEAQYLASAFPQYQKTNGSNFPVSTLFYDAASEEKAYWKLVAQNYGSGNLTLTVYWYADTATSGDVIWGCKISAITPNSDTQDIETDGLATQQTATDTHLGTTGQRLHSIDITISNLDSLANGDVVHLEISRLGNNGSDTMTGDAGLVLAQLSYSDT